jgi:hypothetical protein
MRHPETNLAKLALLEKEFLAESDRVIKPNGGRNREALLRMSELADQMVRLLEEETTELRRIAREAYDLALRK